MIRLFIIGIIILSFTYDVKAQSLASEPTLDQSFLGDKQERNESMSTHSLSFNPFFIPLLSVNLRYNYFFTKRRHWAVSGRATYVSQILNFIGNDTYLIIGGGIKYVPLYYKMLALGVDFTPTYMFELFPLSTAKTTMMYPLSISADLLLSDNIGAAIDVGAAYVTGDVFEEKILPRTHIGIMFMFGSRNKIYSTGDSRF